MLKTPGRAFSAFYLKPLIYHLCRNIQTHATRVRFAPSPTGHLHLGGLRTALYNYLFAKSRRGTFVLRIEDTDQTRKVEGSLEGIISDLKWAGVEYQEGPGRGGEMGPYVQSERLQIYQEHTQKLIENGSAYHCFCTDRRLNLLRRDAVRSQQTPKYDNKCRSLNKQDIRDMMTAGKPFCIRFKLTSDCQVFQDLIFGNIAYDVSLNEGDPVIVKSDGYPTYHFANVVDDHLMGITHVLRGVEWQISTTKHLLLYKAFNWSPPQFGHLPLIVNCDGTKLSKRQGDVRVEDYRRKGIHPLALVNYMTLSGGGFMHVQGEGVRIKTMDELAQEIGNVSPHPSRLNPDLLQECNRLEIKRQLQDDKLLQGLIEELQKLIESRFPNENLDICHGNMKNILMWSANRITKLDDLVSPKFAFLWILPEKIEKEKELQILLPNLVKDLENVNFDEKSVKKFLKEFCNHNNVKFPELMKFLRSALSGLQEGPSVAEMIEILGKEQSLVRLRAVML